MYRLSNNLAYRYKDFDLNCGHLQEISQFFFVCLFVLEEIDVCKKKMYMHSTKSPHISHTQFLSLAISFVTMEHSFPMWNHILLLTELHAFFGYHQAFHWWTFFALKSSAESHITFSPHASFDSNTLWNCSKIPLDFWISFGCFELYF